MDTNEILLSICVPTNGILEWVVPVIESIYAQHQDENLYEVIVMDNGTNSDFQDKMKAFVDKYSNFKYYKTSATGFMCQVDAFKAAQGAFVKFLNHRMIMLPHSVSYLLDFVKQNIQEKPIIYFSNGVMEKNKELFSYESFDGFIRGLSYWSSWSAGLAFWKSDYVKMSDNIRYNELFPHTTVLFSVRSNRKYYICDKNLMQELPTDNSKKGKYDLFAAFAIEYPSIILKLKRDGDISTETFLKVKKDLLFFLTSLYFNFVLLKKKSSYILTGYQKSICVYYSMRQIRFNLVKYIFIQPINKIKQLWK